MTARTHTLTHEAMLRNAGALHRLPTVGIIRRLSRGGYLVYVEDAALKARLLRWRGCTLRATYITPTLRPLGWALHLPAALATRAAALCKTCRRRVSPVPRHHMAVRCSHVRMVPTGWTTSC